MKDPRRKVMQIKSLLRRLWLDDQGQDIAEYAVMLAVIFGYRGRHHPPGRQSSKQRVFRNSERHWRLASTGRLWTIGGSFGLRVI